MNFRKTWLAVLLMLVCSSPTVVQAGSDTADFLNEVTSNLQSITGFMNGTFVNSMGFFTGLGWNTNPTVYDLGLGLGPHFSIGVAAGADFIVLPNLGSLNLPVVSASSDFSLPTGVPLPFPVATARIGLFSGFDAGFRYTYLPPVSALGVGGNFTGWGIDLRYKVFDGMTAPTVTLSTSFDTMTGTLNVNPGNISQTVAYTDPNSHTTYDDASFSGQKVNYALNWMTRSVGAKITIGKSLGILYPYAAVGFQRNSGSITSTITGNFTADLDGSETITPTVVSSGVPVVLEPKYVLGLDLGGGPGLQIAAVGESNGTDVAGTLTISAGF